MKCSSKVIMGATMAMVIILAFVLTLILVLLAELYCSLLLRRRKLKAATKPGSSPENPSISEPQDHHESLPSPLSAFYAQGVLDAPRSFLFPKLPSERREERRNPEKDGNFDQKQKHAKLHQFLRIHSPINRINLASFSSSPSPTYISVIKPAQPSQVDPKPEIEVQAQVKLCSDEDLVYISNPIYDDNVTRPSQVVTPFETPGSSPTRLDKNGLSREERENPVAPSSPPSLPLTPMKELPAKACSVALTKDGSDSNNSQIGQSSSSSGSPRTSPSW